MRVTREVGGSEVSLRRLSLIHGRTRSRPFQRQLKAISPFLGDQLTLTLTYQRVKLRPASEIARKSRKIREIHDALSRRI